MGFHGILSCNGAARNSLGFRVGASLSRCSQDVEQCRRTSWCLFYLALESLIESCLAKSWNFFMLNLGPCLWNLKLRHVTNTSEKTRNDRFRFQGSGWMNNKSCSATNHKGIILSSLTQSKSIILSSFTQSITTDFAIITHLQRVVFHSSAEAGITASNCRFLALAWECLHCLRPRIQPGCGSDFVPHWFLISRFANTIFYFEWLSQLKTVGGLSVDLRTCFKIKASKAFSTLSSFTGFSHRPKPTVRVVMEPASHRTLTEVMPHFWQNWRKPCGATDCVLNIYI